MTARKPNETIFLLDMMMFKPDRCKDEIKRLVNESKINPTIVMERKLADKLYQDLHALGLTVRENIITDDNGDIILKAEPISVGNVKVTYLKYHPDVIADRTRQGGPYYYEAAEHV